MFLCASIEKRFVWLLQVDRFTKRISFFSSLCSYDGVAAVAGGDKNRISCVSYCWSSSAETEITNSTL